LAYPGVNIRPVGVDLTSAAAGDVIKDATKDLDIAMLINNAGLLFVLERGCRMPEVCCYCWKDDGMFNAKV